MSVPPRSRGAIRLQAQGSYITRALRLPAQNFVHTEQVGGIVLLLAAVVALVWVNSPWDESYHDLWSTVLSLDVWLFEVTENLEEWVNDGLMALFFFVVGLEIKREMLHGELSTRKKAALPIFAALGGMIVPAGIYAAFNAGGEGADGWGIPMATDIAFALGVLALLGRRLPSELRILLLGLAVVDDLGSILVIAIFYTDSLSLSHLGMAVGLLAGIGVAARLGIRNLAFYAVVGTFVWVAVLKSGVHATVAGVALGLMTPATAYYTKAAFAEKADSLMQDYHRALEDDDSDKADVLLGEMEELAGGTESPLERLERLFHPWTAFLVLPVFALANAGIPLSGSILSDAASEAVTIGVFAGLLAGKVLGISTACWLGVHFGLAVLPNGVRWSHVIGVSILGAIGFTVAIFIAGLALDDPGTVDRAKIGILSASVISGVAGYLFLRFISTQPDLPTLPEDGPVL